MNEGINRLINEREHLDRGLSASVVLSMFAHTLFVGGGVLIPFFLPREPILKVADGFAVPMPLGGGGTPTSAPPAPVESAPVPVEPAPAPNVEPPPAPKIIKPPNPEAHNKGLPELSSRRPKIKPERSSIPRPEVGGTLRGTGTPAQTPGLEFGPPGPGVPGGTDLLGDWYLAGVQRKIWLIWTQQVKTTSSQPITVTFTILADGSVTDVRTIQSSGVSLLDLSAQRAIYSAAPFGPLPKNYGTNQYTIQAIFKPTS